MTTDFCALYAELIDALDECQRPYGDQPESFLVWKARAALAESVPSAKRERSRISIDEMCEILRSLEIKATEYTDCTILYEVTFDQLRAICDTRAALAEQPVGPTPLPGDAEGLAEVFWGRYAQPEPVGPTDEELLKTYCDARRAFYFEDAEGESDQGDRKAAAIAGLRAVLARWGNHQVSLTSSTQPLPEQEVEG